MNEYWKAISSQSDPARRVGWKHRLDQLFRYIWVAKVLERLPVHSVLDLGCGLGGFASHLQDSRTELQWTGVEILDHFVAQGKEANGGRWLHGDFRALDIEVHDAVICIGGLVDGASRGDRQRIQYLREALQRSLSLSRCVCVWVILDEERLRARPWAHDDGLLGVRGDELKMLHSEHADDWNLLVSRPLTSELGVVFCRRPDADDLALPDTLEVLRDVYAGTEASRARKAWLACEVGAHEKAIQILEGAPDGLDHDVERLVRERVRLQT